MALETDHDLATVASLKAELARFGLECRYDESLKKIVYQTGQAALRVYLALQREEMLRHKWIESEKAGQDLKRVSLSDWVKKYSISFSQYWRRTHVFIPAKDLDG